MIDNLTIYFPYYNQPNQLIFQLENFLKFDIKILNKLHIFIVDDGSQREPALKYVTNKYINKLNLILYKINIDIPWNMPEANNLAFREIKTEYIIRTDIDHYFDEYAIKNIFKLNVEDKNFYTFLRKTNENKIINNPPNIYLVSKKNYWETKGYNEYFSGNYGDDIEFLPRLKKYNNQKNLNIFCIVRINNHTRGLYRNIEINRNKLKNKNKHITFVHYDKYIKQLEFNYC